MPDEMTTSQAKFVDMALLYRPTDPESPDLIALENLLRSLPPATASLNQSDYGILQQFPAPVSIVTKKPGGDVEEAKAQLGVWTASWYERLRNLCPNEKQRLFDVPLLLVEGDRWSLYVACEEKSAIHNYGPEELGSTNSIAGLYRLVAILKAIGKWVEIHFWPWFSKTICSEVPAKDVK